MIRLQTLGSLDLRAPDGRILQPILRQPKRLALLAYLAIEKPGQFHRRDELLGLFWAESDLKGGRASLSQAIHFLRQYLGKDAIINRGDEEIGIATDQLWCDARAFQELLAEKRYAEALDLYGGSLLPAFFVDEASGFEQWVEQKRDTLQREAMRACIALADEAEAAAEYGGEVEWLRKAISYFPFDESLHRRLIRAYDMAGDRAAALLAFDDLVETLRRELDTEPSAETVAVVQAVRTRSEARPLNEPVRNGQILRATASIPASTSTRPRRVYAALVVVAAVAISVALWAAFTREKPAREAPVTRIAVLFFDDASPNKELEYLADGLTSTLIDQLGQLRQVEVISRNGVRPFRGDSIPLDSISRQLDVGTIVGGTITRSGDMLRVTVEIVKGASGIVAQSERFERPVGELFALLDDISAEVGTFLRESLGQEIRLQHYQRETENVEAWQAVRQAEQLLQDEVRAAIGGDDVAGTAALFDHIHALLVRASTLDRRWDQPLVVQAQAYERKAWMSVLDPEPAPGRHLALGRAAADQAISRNPRSAGGWEARGRIQFAEWMLTRPAPDKAAALLRQAENDLRQALLIDSDRARSESTLSMLYETQGRFADSRQAARRAVAADAYLEDADQILVRLFQSSFELDDDEEAGHWCDAIRGRLTGRWPAAYCDLLLLAYGSDGKADARKALHTLETFGARDPAGLRSAMRPRLALITAIVLAKSGQLQRAHQLADSAWAAAPDDVELLQYGAAFKLQTNQLPEAARMMRDYLARNPIARPRIENGRMFRPLRASLVTRAAR